jgi:hypothetical protein
LKPFFFNGLTKELCFLDNAWSIRPRNPIRALDDTTGAVLRLLPQPSPPETRICPVAQRFALKDNFTQFLAVCRRSNVVSMGTSRQRKGLRLCRRCALPRRGAQPRPRQM